MQRITVSILVIAALALAGLAGTSTASAATVLCKANESPCANANVRPPGTSIGGWKEKEKVSLTLNALLVGYTCKGGYFGATSTAEAGNPLPANGFMISSYCTVSVGGNPPQSCSSLTVSEPPTTVVATGGGSGTLTYGTPSQHLSVTFTCQYNSKSSFTCKWGAESVPLTLDWGKETFGATNAPLTLEEKSGEGSVVCYNSAKLTISTDAAYLSYISTF